MAKELVAFPLCTFQLIATFVRTQLLACGHPTAAYLSLAGVASVIITSGGTPSPRRPSRRRLPTPSPEDGQKAGTPPAPVFSRSPPPFPDVGGDDGGGLLLLRVLLSTVVPELPTLGLAPTPLLFLRRGARESEGPGPGLLRCETKDREGFGNNACPKISTHQSLRRILLYFCWREGGITIPSSRVSAIHSGCHPFSGKNRVAQSTG